MAKTSFYSIAELNNLGLKAFGQKVLISRYAKIYGASNIKIGDNVRIDDFCVLSGRITLGSHIHIGAGTHLVAGSAGIEMENFSGLSGRSAVYATTDDYSGKTLTNVTIPGEFKNITEEKILIKKHAIIGTGSTILQGVIIGEGCSFSACSLINKSTEPWSIYAGSPARKIKDRQKKLLELEAQFLKKWSSVNDS